MIRTSVWTVVHSYNETRRATFDHPYSLQCRIIYLLILGKTSCNDMEHNTETNKHRLGGRRKMKQRTQRRLNVSDTQAEKERERERERERDRTTALWVEIDAGAFSGGVSKITQHLGHLSDHPLSRSCFRKHLPIARCLAVLYNTPEWTTNAHDRSEDSAHRPLV